MRPEKEEEGPEQEEIKEDEANPKDVAPIIEYTEDEAKDNIMKSIYTNDALLLNTVLKQHPTLS